MCIPAPQHTQHMLSPHGMHCMYQTFQHHLRAAAVGASREDSHALHTKVDEGQDHVVYCPIRRGDITVHNERVVHGSGGQGQGRQGWGCQLRCVARCLGAVTVLSRSAAVCMRSMCSPPPGAASTCGPSAGTYGSAHSLTVALSRE